MEAMKFCFAVRLQRGDKQLRVLVGVSGCAIAVLVDGILDKLCAELKLLVDELVANEKQAVIRKPTL